MMPNADEASEHNIAPKHHPLHRLQLQGPATGAVEAAQHLSPAELQQVLRSTADDDGSSGGQTTAKV